MAFPQTVAPTETAFAVIATEHLVDMPSSVASNSLLMMICTFGGNLSGAGPTTTATTPAGWTELFTDMQVANRTSVFLKVADGTEGGTTVDVVTGLDTGMTIQVYEVTDWFGALAGVEAGVAVKDSTNAPNSPSLTPTWGALDTLWFAVTGFGDDDETIDTYPTDYLNGVDTNNAAGANASNNTGSARRELNATSDDPAAFALSDSEGWVANTIVVRPSAVTLLIYNRRRWR